jgi:membrane fusion protein, multidrug efflux system
LSLIEPKPNQTLTSYRMTSRQIIIVLTGIAVLAGAFGLNKYLSSKKESPEKQTPPEFKKFVKTKTVRYEDIRGDVTAYGRVKTSAPLDLISEVSGRLNPGSVKLKEGEKFRRGALLFVVDDTEAKFTLQSQKSDFMKDVAAILPDIKIDMNDSFEAWNNYFRSLDVEKHLPRLPEPKSEKEKTFLATKGIYSKFYTIKSLETKLDKHRYYAPFDGSFTHVNLQTGSFVNVGTNIGKVLRSDLMELKLSVETRDISWVKLGAPVTILGEDQVSQWRGKISRISEYVNSTTQSIDVFVDIAPGQTTIYDGQYFKANIPGTIIRSAVEMPRNAIFEGNQVYVLNDSTLKATQVNVLKLNPETAIVNGLDEGSELVVEPLVSAYSGMKAFKLSEKNQINLETTTEAKALNK